MTEPPSDLDAVARARAGDHEAFRVLVERHQARAVRVAARILRDEEQARDAVQEAFLKAYASLDKFEGRSRFYTWLYRLVVNVCLDMRRRDPSGRRVEWLAGPALEAARFGDPEAQWGAERSTPAVSLERAELREALVKAVERLSEGQRETLLLREVDGLSYAEIADALDISKGTVMSRLHYARKKVLRELVSSGALGPSPPRAAQNESNGWR